MKLRISNIKIDDIEFPDSKDMMRAIGDCITSKLIQNNILSNANIGSSGDLVFSIVPGEEPQKLFLSKEKNIVPLKPDDPRAKKLKREHLFTSRLTKKQSDLVWNNCINETLSKLGVSCCISLQEFDNDLESSIILRDGYSWKDFPIKEKNYPQAKV